MTVVVGYSTENNFYLAADDETSNRYTKVPMCESKIFNFGDLFLGVAGRIKIINAFEYWDCPKRKKDESLDKYLKTTFMKALEKQLEKAEVIGRDKGILEEIESHILIACKEGLYLIQQDLSIYKLKTNLYAIGSGEEVAWGALEMMEYLKRFEETPLANEDLLKKVVLICNKHCLGVGNNCTLLKGDK